MIPAAYEPAAPFNSGQAVSPSQRSKHSWIKNETCILHAGYGSVKCTTISTVTFSSNMEEEEEMFHKLWSVFRAHGVAEENIAYMISHLNGKTGTIDASKDSPVRGEYKQKLMDSRKHLDLLNDIYHYDCTLFGFKSL